jgi:signal transduction histidine kinase
MKPGQRNSSVYPRDVLDTHEMNRTLRHRLRNHCAGMKFTVDALAEDAGGLHPEVEPKCVMMADELSRLLRFTERMDLLFDQLPAPEPSTIRTVLADSVEGFGRQFPWCDVQVEGPDSDRDLERGSWFSIAWRELMVNAGEAAGRNGEVRVLWQVEPVFAATVIDVGSPWPERIPRSPPVPFFTTRGQHDGIGLAIAYRFARAAGLDLEVMTSVPDVVAVRVSASDEGGQTRE